MPRPAPASLLALAIALAVGLAAAASAGAYTFQDRGQRWEIPRVPVWVGSASLRVPAARAIAQWNALGLRVRFVRTASRRQAYVTLRTSGQGCSGGVTQVLGASQRGVAGGRRYSVRYIARARVLIAPGCGSLLGTLVVAHELGHVLGLGHETRRCALMNPAADGAGVSPQCPARPLAELVRDPLRPDDRAGARALYQRPLSTLPLRAYERYIVF